MCLAVPARLTKLLPEDRALAEIGGASREISLALVDGVAEGDYVIVHVGYALARLDPDEAEKTLRTFEEYWQAGAREAQENAS